MNTAVLYDAREEAEVGPEELLAGQPLYIYSLKRFWLHSNIDSIAFAWGQEAEGRQAMQYIEKWEKEYGICKPVWMLTRAETLEDILMQIRHKTGKIQNRKETDLFVFHDIRYPFANDGMIDKVQQNASVYGMAVTAKSLGENIFYAENILDMENASFAGHVPDMPVQKRLEPEKFCCVKYPAAVRRDNELLAEGQEIELHEILERIAQGRPHLCRMEDRYPAVCTKEELEFAEAVIKVGHGL